MSGGRSNYAFYHLDEYEGQEWYTSVDYGSDTDRESVQKFKGDRTERLERIMNEACDRLKDELLKMI